MALTHATLVFKAARVAPFEASEDMAARKRAPDSFQKAAVAIAISMNAPPIYVSLVVGMRYFE